MIKAEVRFNVTLYVELQKDSIETLQTEVPSMAFDKTYDPKKFKGWTEFTETFEFDTLTDFMINFDKTVKEYFEGYVEKIFGHDIWFNNYIAIENVKWTFKEITGIMD